MLFVPCHIIQLSFVMAGLVRPSTSSFLKEEAWIPGTSPGMTVEIGELRSQLRDSNSQTALNLLHPVAFDHVALPHVLVIFEGHAAFHAGADFAHVILEAFELR